MTKSPILAALLVASLGAAVAAQDRGIPATPKDTQDQTAAQPVYTTPVASNPVDASPCDPALRACLATESWALAVRISSPGVEPRDLIGGRWQGEVRSSRWRAAARLDALGLPGTYKTGEIATARTVEAHLAGAWDAARLPGGITLGPALGIGAAVALDDQDGARPRMPQRVTAGAGLRVSWPRGWVWAVAGCHQATRGVAAVAVYQVRISDSVASVGAFAVGSRSWVATTGVAVRVSGGGR